MVERCKCKRLGGGGGGGLDLQKVWGIIVLDKRPDAYPDPGSGSGILPPNEARPRLHMSQPRALQRALSGDALLFGLDVSWHRFGHRVFGLPMYVLT